MRVTKKSYSWISSWCASIWLTFWHGTGLQPELSRVVLSFSTHHICSTICARAVGVRKCLSDYMLRCATGNPCGFHVPTVPRKMILMHCTTIYWIRKLAQRKHFPAINWNISFSKYIRIWAFICRFQAAEKDDFHIFLDCSFAWKQPILFATKQPLHGCKVFWSHTSRSMTQSTATWQLEETCDLSSLRTFVMSHDWNKFHFVPSPQSCTCRFTVWVPKALEMHIPTHVSPCVR